MCIILGFFLRLIHFGMINHTADLKPLLSFSFTYVHYFTLNLQISTECLFCSVLLMMSFADYTPTYMTYYYHQHPDILNICKIHSASCAYTYLVKMIEERRSSAPILFSEQETFARLGVLKLLYL